ncbi:hypothetical protein YC2023_037692 [Brassica napus]
MNKKARDCLIDAKVAADLDTGEKIEKTSMVWKRLRLTQSNINNRTRSRAKQIQ